MAVFAPIPKASVRITVIENPGNLRSWRIASFKSCMGARYSWDGSVSGWTVEREIRLPKFYPRRLRKERLRQDIGVQMADGRAPALPFTRSQLGVKAVTVRRQELPRAPARRSPVS